MNHLIDDDIILILNSLKYNKYLFLKILKSQFHEKNEMAIKTVELTRKITFYQNMRKGIQILDYKLNKTN